MTTCKQFSPCRERKCEEEAASQIILLFIVKIMNTFANLRSTENNRHLRYAAVNLFGR
jgi:hypothetical protein